MWSIHRQRLYNRLPRATIASRRRYKRRLRLPLVLAVAASLCVLFMAILLYTWTTSGNNTATELTGHGFLRPGNHTSTINEDWPLIHIVNTRFMQEQGHLTTLARARLLLFETFCLPTMIHQTSQSFLWIIKTDPNLDESIRTDLVSLLKPYPNFYLVGSNHNYQIGQGPGSWRDGSEGEDILTSTIYTGNIKWLLQAHALRSERPILETRLDADDGFHKVFLQYVQHSAIKYLGDYRWLYWCSRRHIEWYASPLNPRGLVNPVQHEKLCITPGITVGFPVNSQQDDEVPQFGHDILYKEIEHTGGCHVDDGKVSRNDNLECIQLVDDLSFVAVRSRTPTSAGMKDIELEQKLQKEKSVNMIWTILNKIFYISEKKARNANQFVQDNLAQIAKENLEGQCTSGHSCKNSSVILLQKLMKNEE